MSAALPPIGFPGILRLGLVQSALGGLVMLTTSMLNRVMVVEYALPALLPAALIALHYGVQLARPGFGHLSDRGGRRTPLIVAGMGVLAIGALLATNAVFLMAAAPVPGILLGILAFVLIGGGVGASGTSLLALLAARVPEARRPAAAATTWIMMVAGIALTAGISSQFLDPFSPARLATVAGVIAGAAFLLTLAAVAGMEGRTARSPETAPPASAPPETTSAASDFRSSLMSIWEDPRVRLFTVFVGVSMLAYSMQDVILEPFAGLVFSMTPGETTKLSSFQHMGVLAGMLLVGAFGRPLARYLPGGSRALIVLGCTLSGIALLLIAAGASTPASFPLVPVVMLLGFGNGMFAVSAIAGMMDLAGLDGPGREGIRMGLWGAAQAIAFGLGGMVGAGGADLGRALLGSDAAGFAAVFMAEAALFAVSALLATRIHQRQPAGRPPHPTLPKSMGATA
jgi:BCD family chlorophyll transporter-like MFS transporter